MSFEGSYLGAADRIGPRAVMECKICWTPYDPAEGDDYRQIPAGTPFADLPDDWHCPGCDAPKAQFMVLEDPDAGRLSDLSRIADQTDRLVADFREIWNAKMRDVPLVNHALHVEAVGFRGHAGGALGVLVAPWFMNLILLPGPDDNWSALVPGAKEVIDFPSGAYEFIHNRREMVGAYKACSLFSPMADFSSQLQAVEVARAVMGALFDADNRDGTDRAAEIRASREAAQAGPVPPGDETADIDPAPTRRALLTGGLAAPVAAGG
jgi:[NiFe] hydrogenase assembly HybE family chaperone